MNFTSVATGGRAPRCSYVKPHPVPGLATRSSPPPRHRTQLFEQPPPAGIQPGEFVVGEPDRPAGSGGSPSTASCTRASHARLPHGGASPAASRAACLRACLLVTTLCHDQARHPHEFRSGAAGRRSVGRSRPYLRDPFASELRGSPYISCSLIMIGPGTPALIGCVPTD
jgi:hypothetical protein